MLRCALHINSGRIIYNFAFGATAFAEHSAAIKAPVGLLSGRAVCVSRWREFTPTSSAERSKRIFTRGDVVENGSCSAAFCESAALWADQRFQWGRMQLPATFGPCPQEIHSGKIRRFSYIANYNGFTLSIPSTTQEHTRLLRCKTKKAIVFAFLHQRWLRIGAADEARTRYLHLGKVALYQMSYGRISGAFIPAPSRFSTVLSQYSA